MRSKNSFGGAAALLCAVLSIGCSLLRMQELYRGFEPSTGLTIPGEKSVWLLRGAVLVTLLIFGVLTLLVSREKRDYKARYVEGPGSTMRIVGMALLTLSGPADLLLTRLSGGEAPVSRLILMALGSLTGALGLLSLLEYKKAESERLRGFFALAPTFFGSYFMVILYRDIAAIPAVEEYAYLMLGAAGLVLAWYFAAAHNFEIGRPGVAFFTAAFAFLMLCLCVFGDAGAYLVHGILPRDVGIYPYLTAGLLWSFGGICAYAR